MWFIQSFDIFELLLYLISIIFSAIYKVSTLLSISFNLKVVFLKALVLNVAVNLNCLGNDLILACKHMADVL